MDGVIGWLFGGFLLYVVVALVVLAIRHRMTDDEGDKPNETLSLGAYVPVFLRRYRIRLIVSAILTLIMPLIGCAALLTIFFSRSAKSGKMVYKSEKQWNRDEVGANQAWLASLGPDHDARAARIEAMFAERTETLEAVKFLTWDTWSGPEKTTSYVGFSVKRNLAVIDNREREYLRIVELLNSATDGQEELYRFWRAALIWGDGKGEAGRSQYQNVDAGRPVPTAFEHKGGSVDRVVSAINNHLTEKRRAAVLPAALGRAVADASDRLAPGGQGWLKPEQVAETTFALQSPHVLHIGSFPTGEALTYSGEGSMITIAPPRSGKTQCHVFPNLLTWTGPAVVLDISGDIYETTSKWRAENVGPVWKFSPLEPDASHCYNPLTFVRSHPDYIWEDAKLLAEMMIVPSNTSEAFWDNEARTVLTAAIAHICYSNPPENRPMHAVLDVVYGGEAWQNMLMGLRMAVDVRVMMQHATAFEDMNEKTLSSVLQTARSSLGAWAGERISRVTARSDWSPLDLRGGGNPTIYIYLRPNEVDAYLSLLRVFIGQHIRMLTGGPVPPRGSPPILFMLDELPRLKTMPPVDEALNIGAKYGLRLWMFAQSVGQMQEAYKNADGMMSACAVRAYMNPTGADGLAERLSEEIGYTDSLVDGQRRRVVEAAELAGPAFREQMVVFGLGSRPARVRKDLAWKDATLSARMGAADFVPAGDGARAS